MKRNLLFVFFIGVALTLNFRSLAQVVITNDNSDPHPSAMLQVKSDNKGVLLPQVHLVSLTSPEPVQSPAVGLVVQNIEMSNPALQTVVPGLYAWDGTLWSQLSFPRGVGISSLLVWNGTQYISLPVGLPGQYLTVNSDLTLSWTYGGGGGHSPSVITANPSEIAQYQFKCGGNVVSDGGSAVTQRGICYSTSPNPSITSSKVSGGVGTGLFTVVVSGLTANTLYYLKAYAINNYDTVYGDQVTVQTLPISIATVTTNEPSNITQSSVTIGGNVISDGGTFVYFRGTCYDTIPNPTLEDPKTTDGSGTGQFTSNITGLIVNKTYYFRAYAWNTKGVAYGEQKVVSTACSSTVPVSVTIQSPVTNLCAGTSVTISATSMNAGSAPQYQWILNGENTGVNSSQFTYAPADGDQIYCILSSGQICTTNNPDTSEILVFTVNPLQQPAISILASSDTLCAGTPVTVMATPYFGGTNPTYQWKVNGANVGGNNPVYSYTPNNNDSVICVMTSNANCLVTPQATSNKISLSVNQPTQVSCNISTPVNMVCQGTQVTFNAIVQNGGQNTTYLWKVNNLQQGTNSPVFTYVPVDGDVVKCAVTSDLECTVNNQVTSNEITMSVITSPSPSISISSSALSVCSGTTVLFTASTENLGASTQYQWYVNNLTSGSNSPGFSYIPSNGDVVYCKLTTQVQCTGIVVLNSNSLIMEVLPANPVSVIITPSQNPVCSQSMVVFTAVPGNGGGSPVYQWKVNGSNTGTNSPQFSYIPVNNDQVVCQLTSSEVCAVQNPASSNIITVTVLQSLQVTVDVSASQNPVCSGTLVTFSALTQNAGSSPVYQWFRNDVPFGVNTASVTLVPENNDHIKCRVQSSEMCVAQNPVTSGDIVMTVSPVLPLGITISASSNPVCENVAVTFTAAATNGGQNPVFQWQVNGTVVGSNTPVYTYVPQNSDIVQCFVTNSQNCISGSPAGSNMLTMQVMQPLPVSVTIAPSENSVCSGTLVTMTATPVNGGSSPGYVWKKNGVVQPGNSNQFSFVPVQNDLIACELQSSEPCVNSGNVTSNMVRMHVISNVTAQITIASPADTVCLGSSVTLVATVINGGTTPVFQWMINGQPAGNNQNFLTYIPSDGDHVTCTLTSSASCVTNSPLVSNDIIVHVRIPWPVNVTISPNLNPICDQTEVHFTAIPTNGGIDPVFQWKVNGLNLGGNASTFSYMPSANDVVTCTMNSELTCVSGNPAQSNQVIMAITERKLLGISITASQNPLCEGSVVNIDAATVNAGNNASFSWYVNGVVQTNSGNQLSYFPADNDEIFCEVTSEELCLTGNPALSNTIVIDVLPLVTPTIQINASNTVVCSGTAVSFSASAQNVGTSPQYSWRINGNASGVNDSTFTYTPLNGDVITCELTSSMNCVPATPVLSNSVTMTVNPILPVSVTIVASQNPVCESGVVVVNAIVQNGGTNPNFTWFKNGVQIPDITGTDYQFVPADNDVVFCNMVSSNTCVSSTMVSSNQITMQVMNSLPVSISLSASSNPVCSGTTVDFTASPVNGGTTPQIQWQVNGQPVGNGGVTFSYSPVDQDAITCVLTSNAGCATGSPATSSPLIMIVNPLVQPVLTIAASDDTVCEGSQVLFTTLAVNGGNNPQFDWKVNGIVNGNNASTFTYTPLNGDVITCELTSSLICTPTAPAVSNALTITVNPIVPVSVTLIASENPICEAQAITISAITQNAGQNPQFTWFKNGVHIPEITGPVYQYIPLNNDIIYCTLHSGHPCASSDNVVSNQLTIQILSTLPVSVSISPSSNPVCEGTTVVYTASPVNGGTMPTIQWILNGLPVGNGGLTYSYIPSDQDQITCSLTSNAGCASGNPATAQPVVMTVIPVVSPSLSIAASEDTVCSGALVTFIASANNGGSSPVYQWKVNGLPVGTNQHSYSFNPSNGDQVSCEMTSSLPCISSGVIVSDTIRIEVMPVLTVSVSVAASQTQVCFGTEVTVSAVVINGGSDPVFTWFKNGSAINGVNGPVLSFVPQNSDQIYCSVMGNYACSTSNPAVSNSLVFAVTPVVPALISIVTSANQVCAGTTVEFSAGIENGGVSPAYQWLVNNIPQGSNGPVFAYTPSDGDNISCILSSTSTCITNNPDTSNTITMQVNPILPVGIVVTPSLNPVCNQTPVTFTSAVTNGGTSPSYQWFVNGNLVGTGTSEFTYIPGNNDNVNCVVNSSVTCPGTNPASSNIVNIQVLPLLPVSITITASSNPACTGTPVTFTATYANGGSSPVFQWKVNGINMGSSNPVFIYTPMDSDKVWCELISSENCGVGSPALSDTLTINVLPVTELQVSVNASQNTVCAGTTVTFTADVQNGGSDPVYQWRVNGNPQGNNQPTYSYVPDNGDVVTCSVTSGLLCAVNPVVTSVPVSMIVNQPVQPSLTITASQTTCCENTLVTFNAVAQNGGSSPIYSWSVNGISATGNGPAFSYVPVQNEVVVCTLTSSLSCVTTSGAQSNPVMMTVNSLLTAGIQVNASANSVCAGTTVSYNAQVVNGGTSPLLTWMVNGMPTESHGTAFTYTPLNGDQISCSLQSSYPCIQNPVVNAEPVTMVVNPVTPASVSIAATANPVCAGTMVTFLAIPVNGGSAPVFEWKVNGVTTGSNSSLFSFVPQNNDQVTCNMISNEICPGIATVTSNTLVMGVNPLLPVSVNITGSELSVCAGTQVTLSATAVNSGTNPVYNWKINGVSAAVNAPSYTYTPNNGDSVLCVLSSNALCAVGSPATSNSIILTVNQPVSVSVSVSASSSNNCTGTPVTMHADVINGGSNPSYQWTVNNSNIGSNSPDFTYVPSDGDNVVCTVTSTLGCVLQSTVTSLPYVLNVNPVLPVSVTITPSANPVCIGSSVTVTANGVNPGNSPTYQWYLNSNPVQGTSGTYTYIPANGDIIRCVLTSNALCTSGNPAVSNTEIMGVNNMLYVGSVGTSQVSCAAGVPALLTATPPSNGFNPVYQWQRSFDNVNFADIPGATGLTCQPDNVVDTLYYRQLQNASGTCGGPLPTNSVNVIVVPPVAVQVTIAMTTAGTIYLGAPASFIAYPVNGGENPGYQWFVNGQLQGSGNTFTYIPQNNDAVKCIMTSSVWCATGSPATSNTVFVTVSPDPLVPVAVNIVALNPGPVCSGTMVSFKAIPGNGGLNPIFQWKVNGTPIGANDSIFTYLPSDGDHVTCTLTSSLPNATGNPATSNMLTVSVLPIKVVSLTINASATQVCTGTLVTFVASPVNGGNNPVFIWKVNNIISGNNSSLFSYVPQNLDQISCTLQSSEVCSTPASVSSNTITIIVNPSKTVGITILPSENPVCSGSAVSFTSSVTNQGAVPVYQWSVNGVSQGSNAPVFNYIPANNDVVTCVLTSDEMCSVNNPASSNAVTMGVNTVLPVSITVNASATTMCEGTSVLMTATPVNGGSNSTIQWFLNGQAVGTNAASFMFNPQDHDSVYCILTVNGSCYSGNPAKSNTIGFNVNPLVTVEHLITASANPVCAGTTVNFTSTATNVGDNPVYQWKVNGVLVGTNSANYSYTSANNDNITCTVTSSASCVANNPALSNTIHMTVTPKVTMTATISASQNNVCAGTIVVFNCSTVNAGPHPSYQWKVNNVNAGTDTTFSYIPQNSDQVKCLVTALDQCLTNVGNKATSNIITMKVNPVQVVTINVTPSANPVCSGANVTFNASAVNGGTSPVYQWKVNGLNVGSNLSTYNYVPLNSDQVACSVRSSVACPSSPEVTSSPVVMNVQQLLQVGISVTPSVNPSCAGSMVTFSASPVNGGTTPVYQWKVNGSNVGNSSQTYSYVPAQGDNIACVLTSSASCVYDNPANSDPVVMNVNPTVDASVTVVSSANNTCYGTQVTFTASPVNGGNAPVYQWKLNGNNVGSNSISYSFIPVDHDTVYCLMYSSENCPSATPVVSNKIGMAINPSPVAAVTIQSDDTTLCYGTSVVCTATPVNGGSNPSYQWLLNGNPVGSNSPTYSFTPAPGASLTCVMTSSLLCVTNSPATSEVLDFTVYNVTQASVTIAASPSGAVCQSSTVVFTATPVNGGNHPGYQWKLNGTSISGATGATYSYNPVNGNVISCVMTSDAPCISGSPATSNSLTMTVNPSTPVSVTIGATKYAVMPSTSVKFYAIPVNGGSTPTYTWYVNSTQVLTGATSYTYNPANNDNVKCVVTSSLPGCLSNNPATSNIISMIVYTTGTACSGTPTVVYGGKTYNTVQIGTQCWLRENLNIGSMVTNSTSQSNNSVIEKYCYTNDTMYCNVYGGLYQWAEMVQYLNGVTNTTHWNPLPTGNVQGVCPTGWHIPSKTEAETLTGYLGNTVAGGRMKETGYVHWNSPNTGASNNVGFTALPAGHVYNSSFENLRMYTNMWTIAQGYLVNAAIVFGAAYNSDDPLYGETLKTTGYSVRCIKN
jgi:uncharacterized protein (TIGR02145 family)